MFFFFVSSVLGTAEQNKAIFNVLDDSLSAELAYFGGESASIDLKVIGELLSVKWDLKRFRSRFARLNIQISEQLFPRRAVGGDLDALMEGDRLLRKILHYVIYYLLMEKAGA